MQEAIQNGLPTWESIQKEYDSRCDEDGYLTNKKDSGIIQNQIIYLTNFIRSHFADKSLFADKSEMDETEITSSSFNEDYGTFVKHKVIRVKEGSGTVLKVKDNTENSTRWNSTIKEWKDVNGQDVPVINVMTCDRSFVFCSKRAFFAASPKNASTAAEGSGCGKTLQKSPYCVISVKQKSTGLPVSRRYTTTGVQHPLFISFFIPSISDISLSLSPVPSWRTRISGAGHAR